MMQQHGGNYTLYHSKTKVSHVIAENLCQARLNDIGFGHHHHHHHHVFLLLFMVNCEPN
jgi:hypothetical protein